MKRALTALIAVVLLTGMINQAWAQVAPTAAELAKYTALHAAAAQGDPPDDESA